MPSPPSTPSIVQPQIGPPSVATPPRFKLPADLDVSPPVLATYLRQLAHIAVDLAALAKAGCAPGAIRMLRQRLTQWIEDLRSVGGDRDLATAVEDLVARLTAALAAPATLRDDVTAVADALAVLAVLASDGQPPSRPRSRGGFWK